MARRIYETIDFRSPSVRYCSIVDARWSRMPARRMFNDAERRPIQFVGEGGVTLAGDEWGHRRDPPVVFLHGAGQSRRAWDDTAASVAAEGWRAVAVDLRGHGDSGWPASADYEFHHFAGDLRRILDQLERAPVVVGASLGGIATLVAQGSEVEQLYRGVVLVDVTPRMELGGVRRIIGFMLAHPDGFESLEQASEVIAAYTGRPRPESTDGLLQVLRLADSGRWCWHWDVRFVQGRAESVLTESPERFEVMNQQLLDAARKLRVPTLIVRGEQSDLVSPQAVRELLAAVPGASYVDVHGAGHMVAGDQNDPFTAAVVQFLRGIPAG